MGYWPTYKSWSGKSWLVKDISSHKSNGVCSIVFEIALCIVSNHTYIIRRIIPYMPEFNLDHNFLLIDSCVRISEIHYIYNQYLGSVVRNVLVSR